MQTIHVTANTPPQPPSVATIGFFDGVHRGHQYLIRQVCDEARTAQLRPVVVTFDQHPRKVLQSDWQPRLLSTLDEKLLLLSKTHADATAVVHFDRAMAALTAREFMDRVLRQQLNVRKLVIGYDNRFGHDRREGFDDYVRHGRELGIEVVQAHAFTLNGVRVSSSVVRSLLQEGEVEMARQCLGYPYTLVGRVVKGVQEGRQLGFPTANLDVPADKLVPAAGVYAVTARLQQTVAMRHGMMNIGTRPTFGGVGQTLETNIFDFEDDIYGKLMLVSLVHRVRGERKFASPQALAEQLGKDRAMIIEQFHKDNENE